MNKRKALLISLGMALGTMLLLSWVEETPNGSEVSDWMYFPGAVVAGIFYPEGAHSGDGSPVAALIALLANTIIFFVFWFGLVSICSRRMRPQ